MSLNYCRCDYGVADGKEIVPVSDESWIVDENLTSAEMTLSAFLLCCLLSIVCFVT